MSLRLLITRSAVRARPGEPLPNLPLSAPVAVTIKPIVTEWDPCPSPWGTNNPIPTPEHYRVVDLAGRLFNEGLLKSESDRTHAQDLSRHPCRPAPHAMDSKMW